MHLQCESTTDKGDGARFFSGWMENANSTNQKFMWTDFDRDGQGATGNHHSLYLYFQRQEVRQTLGFSLKVNDRGAVDNMGQANVLQTQPYPYK